MIAALLSMPPAICSRVTIRTSAAPVEVGVDRFVFGPVGFILIVKVGTLMGGVPLERLNGLAGRILETITIKPINEGWRGGEWVFEQELDILCGWGLHC